MVVRWDCQRQHCDAIRSHLKFLGNQHFPITTIVHPSILLCADVLYVHLHRKQAIYLNR